MAIAAILRSAQDKFCDPRTTNHHQVAGQACGLSFRAERSEVKNLALDLAGRKAQRLDMLALRDDG